MFHSLRRYARLYRIFARNNVARELEFRANFWGKVITNLSWLFLSILFLKILYANTHSVAGWSEGHMFLLLGTFMFSRALTDILFTQNLSKIPEMVRTGTMDFVLTKPVPSLFYVSTLYLSLDEIGSLFGAVAVLAYGCLLTRTHPSPAQFVAWAVLTLCGLLILYAFQLVLMTLSFWLVRIDNLSALVDTVVFAARYPPDIFSASLKMFVTYFLPLAFVAYIPALALKAGASAYWLGTGVVITTLFVSAASFFWRYATQAYTSASS